MKHIFCVMSLLFLSNAYSQNIDSTVYIYSIGDTLKVYHENVPKSKLWGNSWNTSLAYNISKSNELRINIGRTYGRQMYIKGYDRIHMVSWGINYSIINKRKSFGAYIEHSKFDFHIPLTGRLDVFYEKETKLTYIRPSFGIHLFALDLLYNYSFNLSKKENLYKHGFTINLKWYFHKDNWERNYSD